MSAHSAKLSPLIPGALLCVLLAQPQVLEVRPLPVRAVKGVNPEVGLALLGSSAYLAWTDDRLAQSRRARFPTSPFEPTHSSLWLSEFVLVGATPSVLTTRLLCTGETSGDLFSPRLASNGGFRDLLLAFVEQDLTGMLQRVRLAQPNNGTAPCGADISLWSTSPIEDLKLTRVGDSALVSWRVGTDASVRWFNFDGTPRTQQALFQSAVTGALGVGVLGTGASAVAFVAWPAPAPEGAVVTQLDQSSTSVTNSLVVGDNLGTQISGVTNTDATFLLFQTDTGVFRGPFASYMLGNWSRLTGFANRTPLLARTGPQTQLAAIAPAGFPETLMVLGLLPSQQGPQRDLVVGDSVIALESSTANTVVALSNTLTQVRVAKVTGADQLLLPPTLEPQTVAVESRAIQRSPSVVWSGGAWLVAWEEIDLFRGRTVDVLFARVSLEGAVSPVARDAGLNLVNPTLLQRPDGGVALAFGPLALRRAATAQLAGQTLSLGAGSQAAGLRPSALVGAQRTVQWSANGADTQFQDTSSLGPQGVVLNFSAAPMGVATPEGLWVPGLKPSGSLAALRWADRNVAPSDLQLSFAPSARTGAPLNIAARTTDAGTQLLLGWVDLSGNSQLGTFSADAGLLSLGPAPVDFTATGSIVGDPQGWFMAGADLQQAGLAWALVSESGAVLERALLSPGTAAAQPFVASGPGGARAVAWAELQEGNSVLYLALDPGANDAGSLADAGAERDAGAAGDGGAPDAGNFTDAGSSTDAGGAPDAAAPDSGATDGGNSGRLDFRYQACGCGGAPAAPLGAALIALLALRRARPPRRAGSPARDGAPPANAATPQALAARAQAPGRVF